MGGPMMTQLCPVCHQPVKQTDRYHLIASHNLPTGEKCEGSREPYDITTTDNWGYHR
jgi:hypothetical protein